MKIKIKRKDQYIETPFNDDGTIHLFKRDRIEFTCSKCGCDVNILAQNLTSQGQHYNNLLPDSELLCKKCLYKKTNLEKYGVENVSQSSEIKEKKKTVYLEHLGVESPLQSEEIKEKIKQTNLEKYGVENVSQSKEIRDKAKQTNLEKYGVENVSQFEEIKEKKKNTCLEHFGVENSLQSTEIRDKAKQTSLEKYGVEYPSQSSEIKEKKKNTCLEHFGVESPLQSNEIKEKVKQTNLEKYGAEHHMLNDEISSKVSRSLYTSFEEKILQKILLENNIILLNDYEGQRETKEDILHYKKYPVKCDVCGNEFETSFRSGFITKCPICFPKSSSIPEDELFEFVSSLGKNVIRNDREIIAPLELDIVVPEIKLAIELDGLYWHSVQAGKDKNYHLHKTILCKEKGYSLMHIFEDEWINKKEIIKSMIRSRFNIFERKVFARKCIVKEIDQKKSKDFFNDNHLQGNVGSSLSFGLFERNTGELLSCLSLGKTRFNKNFDWEITRFAVKKNMTVIGGFSKLWKYFLDAYEGDVITYSDRRLFNGEVYRRNCFEEQEPSQPNYFYFTGNKERYSRVKFQKHKLGNQLAVFDENKTEKENMQENGYYWIYDCGNWVFTYRRVKNG